jgi:hypothetical protein
VILLHEARVVRLAARLVERGQLKSHEFIGVAIDSADAPSIMERAPILPRKFALTILGAVGSIKEILFVVRRRCGLAHRATAVWCCAEPVKFPPPVPHSIALVLKKLRGREPNSRRSIGVMLQNFETVTAASERIDPRNCFW